MGFRQSGNQSRFSVPPSLFSSPLLVASARQTDRQTCPPVWQTLGPALHLFLLLQTGAWARGPDPMWPVN